MIGKEDKDDEVQVISETGAMKGSKRARFDLIPGDALWDLAELYGAGAEKYDERNWEKGYSWSLSYAAMQRHANQFWMGEDFDDETGAPHLAAVAWHAFSLLHFLNNREIYGDFDNRPSGQEWEEYYG